MKDPIKLDDLETLIREFENSGVRELHLRCDEFELYVSSDPNGRGIEAVCQTRAEPPADAAGEAVRPQSAASSAPALAASVAAAVTVEQAWPADASVIRAPYLGTFYRSPKPGSKPYVEIGDAVVAETDLCLVEVMKLFTAVCAGTPGRVHAVLAKDGQLVEGNQPLFVLVPG